MQRALLLVLLATPVALAGCLQGSLVESSAADLPLGLGRTVEQVTSVDPARWSGEPSILALDDGTLLITGAGGLTRYVEDPADAPGNAGQSYVWRSVDGGVTWGLVHLGLEHPAEQYAPYRSAMPGVEGDLAADDAGSAYFVDLAALATNVISRSDDSGATWLAAQNPVVGLPGTDRPWVDAIGDGEVFVKYLQVQTGHRVARSTDGGVTFPEDVALPTCGQGAIVTDRAAQEVIVPCVRDGSSLFLLRSPTGAAMAWEEVDSPDADGPASNVFVTAAVAGAREYMFAWSETVGDGARIRVAATTNGGASWSDPVTVSAPGVTGVFPWLAANAAGDVALVWYEADANALPDAADAQWFVHHAAFTLTADGLSDAVTTRVSEDPVHEGGICTSGLGCVLGGRSDDRRLLDFFEVDVDAEGASHIAWTSTLTDVPTVWYGRVAPAMTA